MKPCTAVIIMLLFVVACVVSFIILERFLVKKTGSSNFRSFPILGRWGLIILGGLGGGTLFYMIKFIINHI